MQDLGDIDRARKGGVVSQNKQVKIYAEHLDPLALQQFNSAMEQDFSVKGALMPDAHVGYSLPIGAVVATDGVILPSWVGFDIGCGMCALPTTFKPSQIAKNGAAIFQEIYKRIPVGFAVHPHPVKCDLNPNILTELGRKAFHGRKGFRSLGTLGGGNHFIEIGRDETARVWVIIHSGSRGVGHGIATEYMRLAEPHNKVKDGHYGFRVNSDEGKSYINDMNWTLEFALLNRKHMMHSVVHAITQYCVGEAEWGQLINRNHNHAEERGGLWIHRKGATQAEDGMLGVIPGNMRDGSFIVRGKGNPLSLFSSSHGAGRVMGRKRAKRDLNTGDFKLAMRGVVAKVDDDTLDESPEAYKNIFEVMRMQDDLVETLHHVIPLVNVKG
ncbi:MAG: tRNA-splicing ligase RtcB [Desulforhopalus sp.]|jgi:tRNA-splicing ligase RtcB